MRDVTTTATVSPPGGSTRETELMRTLQLLLDKLARGEMPVMQESYTQKGGNVHVLLGDIQVRLLCICVMPFYFHT